MKHFLYSGLLAVTVLQVNSTQAQQYSIPTIPPPGTFEKTEYQGTPIGVLAEQFFVEDGWQVSEIYRQEKNSQNQTYMKVSMCSYNDSGSSYNASATSKAYYTDGWKSQFETWKQAHLARGAIFTPSNSKEGYLNFEKRYGLTWQSGSNTCQQLRDIIFAHFESKNASSQSSSTSSSASSESAENEDETGGSSSTASSSSSHSISISSNSSNSSYSAANNPLISSASSSSASSTISSSSSSAKSADSTTNMSSSSRSSSSVKREREVEPITKEQEQRISAPITAERDLQFFKDNAEKPNVLTGVCRRLRNRTSWFAVKVRERCIERALRWGLNP